MRERGPLFHEDKGEEIMYELIKKDGRAKQGVFMPFTERLNTGIYECRVLQRDQGAVSMNDLRESRPRWSFQTHIAHVRPGDEVVKNGEDFTNL